MATAVQLVLGSRLRRGGAITLTFVGRILRHTIFMSEEQKIKGYAITKRGKPSTLIRCDDMKLLDVPAYLFYRDGQEVDRVLASELETPPTLALELTEEEIRAQGQAIRELTRGNFGHHPNLG